MNHEFAVEKIAENMWRHTCQVPGCGATFDKPAPLYHRRCPVLSEPAKGIRGWWRTRVINNPGDFLKAWIHFATKGSARHGIECEHFRRRMNAIGWRGCWRERGAILKRVRSQAAKGGYRNDAASLTWLAAVGMTRWSQHVTAWHAHQVVRIFRRVFIAS